ncbi:unnamed protein product [Caenorhabditis sp. 36 PRJEB53466]|nr:unnamed protein product [Caenorhabditis sp. 36 PRJEB53466]
MKHLMEQVESKSEECGYLSITIAAIFIAVSSAVLTLMIASYMYHGVYDPIELPAEIMTSKVNRLVVTHKKVVLFKVETKNRCYILRSIHSRDFVSSKFSFTNTPLSREELSEVAGPEGVDFCSTTPAFVLDKN